MKQALIFTLKVWLTAMLMAFFGMWEVNIYAGAARSENYYPVFLATVINMSMVSPAYAVPLFLSVWMLLSMNWSTVILKFALTAVTLVCGWWPFMFLVILTGRTEPFSYEAKRSIIVYLILNCACIWFFKLKADRPLFDSGLYNQSTNDQDVHQ